MGLVDRKLGAALVVAIATALPGSAAGATWHQVTATNGGNIDEVSPLRTADGVLHVAWHLESGSNYSLFLTSISPSGAVGSTVTIESNWASMDNPALVAAPGGAMRVFFGGIRTTDPGETNQDLNTALSTDGGATWTLQPGDVAAHGATAYASPIGATAVGSALTPYETWTGTAGVFVHAGLSPATPNSPSFQTFGCCGYNSNLAADASGHIVLVWYSNATGHLGVYAQQVAADGSPLGGVANMPGTANMGVPQTDPGLTPLVARVGGGFYMAYATGYPSPTQIRLWSVGSSSTTTITGISGGDGAASLAAAPDGRLWVIWKEDLSGSPHVFAERSNKSATRFGATINAGVPPGAAAAYTLDAAATSTSLDLLASFARDSSSSVATWYTRLLPGLSLAAKPAKLHRGHKTSIKFTVTDAGDPVKGARVTVGGISAKTNAMGRAVISLTTSRTLKATATDTGYTPATIRLTAVK